jgi:hypothetical protein
LSSAKFTEVGLLLTELGSLDFAKKNGALITLFSGLEVFSSLISACLQPREAESDTEAADRLKLAAMTQAGTRQLQAKRRLPLDTKGYHQQRLWK